MDQPNRLTKHFEKDKKLVIESFDVKMQRIAVSYTAFSVACSHFYKLTLYSVGYKIV